MMRRKITDFFAPQIRKMKCKFWKKVTLMKHKSH